MAENQLQLHKHGLLYDQATKELIDLATKFCGKVLDVPDDIRQLNKSAILYLAGDIQTWMTNTFVKNWPHIIIIVDQSTNYKPEDGSFCKLRQVPLQIHNVGLFIPELFPQELNLYDKIVKEHEFQDLTLGDKSGKAYRTGIYLTDVVKIEDQLHFHLLRCSSNFTGPTSNFRPTDDMILHEINLIANRFYKKQVKLNHVLAQIYHNQTIISEDGSSKRDKKAVIARHSDKTEDMPEDGLIVFFTVLKDFSNLKNVKRSSTDQYDYVFKNQSVLSKLIFRIKKPNPYMVSEFEVKLSPNSVFIISLGINREYTHEIVPSPLPVEHLPTRMGYVIRCSNQKAIFQNGNTFLQDEKGTWQPLHAPNKQELEQLRELYAKQNLTDENIQYPSFIPFSMNQGDYTMPIL